MKVMLSSCCGRHCTRGGWRSLSTSIAISILIRGTSSQHLKCCKHQFLIITFHLFPEMFCNDFSSLCIMNCTSLYEKHLIISLYFLFYHLQHTKHYVYPIRIRQLSLNHPVPRQLKLKQTHCMHILGHHSSNYLTCSRNLS